MKFESYFHNFSEKYLYSISQTLYEEVVSVVSKLPKRNTQSQINNDLFWLFTDKGWTFDTLAGISEAPPSELLVNQKRKEFLKKNNNRKQGKALVKPRIFRFSVRIASRDRRK